jgi:hypothetical protein
MKQSESNGISRRRFATAGLTAGAALLTPGALFYEGIQPLLEGRPQRSLLSIRQDPRSNARRTGLKLIGGLRSTDTKVSTNTFV